MTTFRNSVRVRRRFNPRMKWLTILAIAVAVTLSMTGTGSADVTLIGQPTNIDTRNSLDPTLTSVLRINAGGPQVTDSQGQVWLSDRFSTGGGGTNTTTHAISGTNDPAIFQSERWGSTGYDIPLPNGSYTLELLFAEINPTSGNRVFSVTANDQALLTNHNITSSVGTFAADTQSFPVTVSNKTLHIGLSASSNSTTIAGIQVLAASPPFCQPRTSVFRMNAGGPQVTDSQGQVWQADQFSTGGGASNTTTTPITGTDDSILFQSERWGSTGYDIPLPNGSYTVELSFAEINPSSGTRVFNVAVDGTSVVDNFDISADVGNFTADVKTVPTEVTDGTLHIALGQVKNSTTIAAIQVFTGDDTCFENPNVLRMNAGGPSVTDQLGHVWSADQYSLAGGGSHAVTNPIDRAVFQQPFQSERWGTPGYDIPLPNGNYIVQLGFAELNPSSGERIFNVALNGETVLNNYNIAATVGNFTADKHVFSATVSDGTLHIRFTAIKNSATISAIQIFKGGPGPTPPPPNPDDGWTLKQSDDFNGTSLNTNLWSVYSGPGNEGVGMRTPNNVKVNNGNLELQGTQNFYGAGVSMKYNFTYGRVVITARTDKGSGYGPALLMWPQSEKWPQDGEIDISEIPKGERATSYFTVHWGSNNSQTSTATSGDFSQWHTWVMEWSPTYIKGWIDGVLIKAITTPAAIPTGPMHLALQQDVGAPGHWIPGPDANTPPVVSLHIDNVQVFQKTNP